MTAIARLATALDEYMHDAYTQHAIDRAIAKKWLSGADKNAIMIAAAETLGVLRNECEDLRQKTVSGPVVVAS